MLCPSCGKEVTETDGKCGTCGGSLFLDKRALREPQSTAGGAAPAEEFEQVPGRSSKLIPGLVLGLGLLVFLFVVIPNLQRDGLSPQITSTASPLRIINTAATVYASRYDRGFPPTLAALGPPKDAGIEVSGKAAGLIDDILASGTKAGYRFSYLAGPVDSSGKISTYMVHADPVEPFALGKMHYFTDQTGVIRVEKDREAYASSPPIAE
jgi:hypothetical protein